MKNKIIAICVLVCLLAVSSLGLVACGGDALSVKIDSSKEVTIKVGEQYTLAYTAAGNDSVTVAVTEGADFGAYDETTKKFTASAVGIAKLTVTAVKGEEKVTDVATINITANDKTSLAAAIAEADKLVAADYTNFATLKTAITAAKAINSSAGATATQIADAIASLNTLTAALIKKPIVKAVITAEGISYASKDYSAYEYGNYSEIKTAIEAINGDSTVTLISVYNKKVTEEIKKLVAFADTKLEIVGIKAGHTNNAPKTEGYALTATGTDKALTWYVNGEKKADGANYTFKPSKDIVYTIEARAKDGDKYVHGITEVAFWNKLTYTANHSTTSVDNAAGTITSNDNAGWDPIQKVLGDFWLEGDLSIQFDLTITKKGDMEPNTVAVLLMSGAGRGHNREGEFAIKYRDETLNVWQNEVKSQVMPTEVLESGKTNTFLIERIDGFMHFSIINKETGKKLYTAKTEGDRNWKEKVTVTFNFEDCVGSFADIRISADKITNMSDMAEQIRASKSLIESDYSAGWAEFKTAYDAAHSAYFENKEINQTELAAIAKELKDAIAALTPDTFAKAVVTDEKITFSGVDFLSADYSNYADIKAAITELNKATVASQYTKQIYAELAKLQSEIVQTVTGVGSYGFATFKEARAVEISVSGADGATHKLYVDGVEKTLTAGKVELSFTEAANQTIAVTTTLDGKNVTRLYALKVMKNDFVLNDWKNEVSVDNENCVFEAFARTDWGNFRKVVSNTWLQGDFKITFDATPKKFDGANVMAIILSPHNDWGNDDRGEMAMLFGDKVLKARPDQTRSGVAEAMGELNKTLTYTVVRVGGTIIFSVNDGETQLATVTSPATDYTNDVRMVFNFEHMLGTMGNVNFFATSTR